MTFIDKCWENTEFFFFVKTGQIFGRFTSKHKYVYEDMSLNFFLAREEFQAQVTKKMKIFSIKLRYFYSKLCRLQTNAKNTAVPKCPLKTED